MNDFETSPRGTVESLRAENERLREVLRDLLAFAEYMEENVEFERGWCRSLQTMETAGDLAEEIIAAREALK